MSKIKNWLIRGDCHGTFLWIDKQLANYKPEETAVIVLGDVGFNFYLNKHDARIKKEVNAKGYRIYCLHGNHEARPQDIHGMELAFDFCVNGEVYIEPDYPNIRYFKDFEIYEIDGYRCLAIGGAYSVDKWYRLTSAGIMSPADNNPKRTGWWANECLTEEEMKGCEAMIKASGNNYFDFVFTHTCPYKYQPRDMFLGFVDQSSVDDSMEKWMDKLTEQIQFDIWCFGHYHADRLERPHIEQYFNDIEELHIIKERWAKYDETGELDWWFGENKSPNFYMGR